MVTIVCFAIMWMYTVLLFLESKRLCELGHRNWYTKVLELAQSYNLCVDSLGDSNATKHLIKSTVTAKYVSDWHVKLQDINNNPILRTYKLFKTEFKWECYLNGVKNPKYRKALTKFRTSSHTLEIERGRHTNPTTPLEQRQCRICHVLEDETHFLLCGRMFTDERHDFLDKFIFILQNGDVQVATWTAKFIYHAVKKKE